MRVKSVNMFKKGGRKAHTQLFSYCFTMLLRFISRIHKNKRKENLLSLITHTFSLLFFVSWGWKWKYIWCAVPFFISQHLTYWLKKSDNENCPLSLNGYSPRIIEVLEVLQQKLMSLERLCERHHIKDRKASKQEPQRWRNELKNRRLSGLNFSFPSIPLAVFLSFQPFQLFSILWDVWVFVWMETKFHWNWINERREKFFRSQSPFNLLRDDEVYKRNSQSLAESFIFIPNQTERKILHILL